MAWRTLRALAYLISSIAAGVAGLVWVLLCTVVVSGLAVTQAGGPVFLGAAWGSRRLAGLERRRAGWVLDAAIGSPYVSARARTLRARVAAVAGQPATWRDLAWF